ncbi:MAG: nucleoside:proton symporter [Alphaproteobacteria bacterium]|nr:nucleoside:proton symporter [Alphaproteobacteria bacterium]
MLALQSLFGLALLTAAAWVLSENRRRLGWRLPVAGIGLQVLIALLLLKVPGSGQVFIWLNAAVLAIDDATKAGTAFVFGYLGGGDLPFAEPYPGAGFILAFQALPIVLVMSALSAVLFHWGVLPRVVHGFSWVLRRSFGIGGAVGVAAAANVFVGMVEAPLLVRPYLARLTRSELFMVMTVGMATIAGTVMVLYAVFLGSVLDGALGHLLAASLISAPAALMVARMLVPPQDGDGDGEDADFRLAGSEAHSTMDAVTQGTMNGLALFLNILAMLVVFVALVSLVNQMLGLLPDVAGAALSLERMLGWLLAPVAWAIGVPWDQAPQAGALMGVKTVLNEFIAYLQLSKLPEGALDARSTLIMTYALCGFANFGSLGIMLGGLSAMAPERRAEIVGLGLKSILSGTLATLMTGAVVGVLMG